MNSTTSWCAALGAAFVLAAAAQTPDVDGEVTALDKAQGRITLKHGEIKNLEMPPMKMVFRVQDGKLLDGLSVGDRVRFAADKINGQYVVTRLQPAR